MVDEARVRNRKNIFTRDELMEEMNTGPPEQVSAPAPRSPPQSLSKEIKKETIKKKVQDTQKLENLIKKSRRVLLKISSVFPFVLFPKTIIIEEHKVDIINRLFFFSRQIDSILIDYITSVEVTTSIFFASLHFEVWGMDVNPPIIVFLKKKEALRARRIIQGLLACKKEHISTEGMELNTLRAKLEEIGLARE